MFIPDTIHIEMALRKLFTPESNEPGKTRHKGLPIAATQWFVAEGNDQLHSIRGQPEIISNAIAGTT